MRISALNVHVALGLALGEISTMPFRTCERLIFLTAKEHDCPACALSTATRLLWMPLRPTFWKFPSESGPKSTSSVR
jgi:hypothetical protein